LWGFFQKNGCGKVAAVIIQVKRKEHQTHELRNVRESVILSAFTLQLLLVAGETTMSDKE